VGGSRDIPVDVRILAATNRSLVDEVRQGRFREDLYYRLSVVPISIPPLRERADDSALLARLFVERFGRKLGKKARLSPAGEKEIGRYGWPGNVRELMNAIERAVLLALTEEIGPDELAIPKVRDGSGNDIGLADLNLRIPSDGVSLVAVEKAVIVGALARTNGNVVEAARHGQFSIYPVATIDEGIEILTGVKAGERGAEGRFPAGTINRLVEDKLRTFAERARGFTKGAGNGGEGVRETE
jgi:transcriptional regulator with GAF, ATPase, and Fis domain